MANRYITDLTSTVIPFRRDAEKMSQTVISDAYYQDGIMRWHSNDSVPPQDCVELAAHVGCSVDVAKCKTVRDEEQSAFLNAYVARESKRVKSPEEIAEMRAAFGSGKTVVDVITGQKVRL